MGADSLVVQGHADGRHAVRCKECFSLLYRTGYEGKIRVPYGTLIDEPALKPSAHTFVGSKASWHEILGDLPGTPLTDPTAPRGSSGCRSAAGIV